MAEKRTVKEIKNSIRELTNEINERKDSYTENRSRVFQKMLNKIKAGGQDTKFRKAGTEGDVSYGFSRFGKKLTKKELLEREKDLSAFIKSDIYSPVGRKKFEERGNKSYQTFKELYGDIDVEDWQEFYENIDNLMHTLSDWKYEDVGGDFALQYVQTVDRTRFIDIASKADFILGLKKAPKNSMNLSEQINALRIQVNNGVTTILETSNEELAEKYSKINKAKEEDREMTEDIKEFANLFSSLEFDITQ